MIVIYHVVSDISIFHPLRPTDVHFQVNTEPVRFPYIVTSFLDFTLGVVQELVRALDIKDNDYLATWNPIMKHWETHLLTTGRRVSEQQRLLYKLVCKITTIFPDSECPGIEEEIAQQPCLGKRKVDPDDTVLMGPAIVHSPSPLCKDQVTFPATLGSPYNSSIHPTEPSTRRLSGLPYKRPQHASMGNHSGFPEVMIRNCKVKGDGEIKPQKPFSGKKKKWPTAWTVSEIAAGFKHVEEGQRQRGKVKVLFEQAFCQPIVRSTFHVNRKWWNEEVSEGLKARFISYGVGKRGQWP